MMKMTSVCWRMLVISILILMPCSCVTSFNITKLLSQYPAYTTFTNYLTQTKLADQINTMQTVTVLAVDNTGMGPLLGKSMDHIKNVLSLHVALNYIDLHMYMYMNSNKIITVNTLGDGEALLNFNIRNGTVTFVSTATATASADSNAVVRAKLMKHIVSESHKISVVQVNTLFSISNPKALIPVSSPVPAIPPVILITPVPANSPVPPPSIAPILAPVLAPVLAPLLPISPVPVILPVPPISPVPVLAPGPVINPPPPVESPGSVIPPIMAPSIVPAMGPVLAPSPAPGMGAVTPGSDAPVGDGSVSADEPKSKSGVLHFGVNYSLAILLTLSTIFIFVNIHG